MLLCADVSYEYLGQDAFCRVNKTSAERIQFEVGGPRLVVLCFFTKGRDASDSESSPTDSLSNLGERCHDSICNPACILTALWSQQVHST